MISIEERDRSVSYYFFSQKQTLSITALSNKFPWIQYIFMSYGRDNDTTLNLRRKHEEKGKKERKIKSHKM